MKPSRPPASVLVHVRVPQALLLAVDAYGAELTMTRSAALRLLVMDSLARSGRWPHGPGTGPLEPGSGGSREAR